MTGVLPVSKKKLLCHLENSFHAAGASCLEKVDSPFCLLLAIANETIPLGLAVICIKWLCKNVFQLPIW